MAAGPRGDPPPNPAQETRGRVAAPNHRGDGHEGYECQGANDLRTGSTVRDPRQTGDGRARCVIRLSPRVRLFRLVNGM